MLSRALGWVAGLVFGIAIVAAPAAAVPIDPIELGGGINPLAAGDVYIATPFPPDTTGPIFHNYAFNVTPDSVSSLVALTVHIVPPIIGGIGDLTLSWRTSAGALLGGTVPLVLTDALGFGLSSGVLGPYTLAPIAGVLDYYLRVTGEGFGEGRYDFTLVASPAGGIVPLPPALILFASALVGMTWLGRRRRAAKPEAA